MLRGANTRGQGPGRQARAIERAAWIEIGAGKPQRGRDIAEEVEKVGSVVGDDLVAAVKGAENRLERPPVIIETDILVEGVKFRAIDDRAEPQRRRSEEHTSELQSLMRRSY